MTLSAPDFTRAERVFLKKTYLEAFPPEERPPFRLLRRRARQGRGKWILIEENGARAGFFYLIEKGEIAYLFYFAVAKEFRGKGIGTAALGALLARYGEKRLFLALENWREECENRDERLRRRDFYRKAGLSERNLRLREAKVTYAVMAKGKDVSREEFRSLMDAYLGPVWGRRIQTELSEQENEK